MVRNARLFSLSICSQLYHLQPHSIDLSCKLFIHEQNIGFERDTTFFPLSKRLTKNGLTLRLEHNAKRYQMYFSNTREM